MKQIDILDDIYEDALKIAKERNESVQTVIEQLIRDKVAKRPAPRSIIGAFSDEPEIMDQVMEAVYELRQKPIRISNE